MFPVNVSSILQLLILSSVTTPGDDTNLSNNALFHVSPGGGGDASIAVGKLPY